MGHRANLLLVNDSDYQLYYCHWCAQSLPAALFWGPEYAVRYVEQQRAIDEWLDNVWAEGGALIDRHRKQLLLYGGEDIQSDIPLRNLYLDLLRLMWDGWVVEWAYSGILDIAEYVNYPRNQVYRLEKPGQEELFHPEEPWWISMIGSIRMEDSVVRVAPLAGVLEYIVCGNERLVSAMKQEATLERFSFASIGAEFPTEGFHIDEVNRAFYYWSARSDIFVEEVRQEVKNCWKGWQVNWLNEDYKTHVELTDNRISLPDRAYEDLLSSVRSILLREDTSYVNMFLRVVGQVQNEEHAVTLNRNALQDEPAQIPLALRQELLDDVINRWKK